VSAGIAGVAACVVVAGVVVDAGAEGVASGVAPIMTVFPLPFLPVASGVVLCAGAGVEEGAGAGVGTGAAGVVELAPVELLLLVLLFFDEELFDDVVLVFFFD
jgi:hypothetical protein